LSDVQHKTSQNGNKWASFFVVDYNDSFEFRIFKDDYLKFKPYLIENEFRQIRVNISPGWRNKDGKLGEPRITFTDIQILQDVLEKQAKKLTIKLDIKQVNYININELNGILKKNEGSTPLDILVFDMEDEVKLNMHSRSVKINITNELLKTFETEEIRFKLN
jgi:DNA polymerase-3 subunit alpha